MLDQYRRNIEYIRISITDRCNLRCMYCMPEGGIEQVEHSDILTYDEITRLCRILALKGISKVKITGGEPLVRKNAAELVRMIKSIPGIDAVNISLDALTEEMFEKITRRKGLDRVLEGMDKALQFPDVRVKVNCVLLHGVNEDQWIPIAGLAKDRPIDVRFIEMMPIGYGRKYCGEETEDHVRHLLEKAYGKADSLSGRFGNGPSTYILPDGFKGKIGFISAISHKFCGDCNRVRLTSEGFLKPCLQFSHGADMRSLLRDGSSDEQIGAVAEKIIFEKPRSHRFGEAQEEGLENKKMSEIGG